MPDTAKNTKRKGKIPSNSLIRAAISALIVVCLDQLTKILASGLLFPGESRTVIEGVLDLTLVHNPGAVFGILRGANSFFIIFSAAFVFLVFFYLREFEKKFPGSSLPAGLMAGGAAGNLVDRVRLGYVVDFIDFKIWPVFNIADAAITAGVIILLFSAVRTGKQKKAAEARTTSFDQP